jgi:hypothetical protein
MLTTKLSRVQEQLLKDLEQECWDHEPTRFFKLSLLKLNSCQQIWRGVENKFNTNRKVTYGAEEVEKSERASQVRHLLENYLSQPKLKTAIVGSRIERSGKSNYYSSTWHLLSLLKSGTLKHFQEFLLPS